MIRADIKNKLLVRSKSLKRHRRSLRLEDYDYAQTGAYFITVVTHQRACLFGRILNGELILNTTGQIAQSIWNELPAHFSKIDLDVFVVMPNHIHGIIHIVGAQHAAPLPRTGASSPSVQPGCLGAIVRSFKSAVTKRCNERKAASGRIIWQRNYYEHVIRNEASLHRIQDYIATNPARWSTDPENPLATRPELHDAWRNDRASTVGAQHAAPLHAQHKT
jgi:putative transposase